MRSMIKSRDYDVKFLNPPHDKIDSEMSADDCSEGELEGISNGWRTVYRRLKYRGAVHR